MKKIYQILKMPFAVYHFIEAWDLLAQGKYKEAESRFEQGEKYSDNLMYEFLIMKGKIKFSLKKRQECLDCFVEALEKIIHDKTLPTEDALYLKAYITGCLEVYKKYLNYNLNIIEFIPIESIDLQKVDKNLIKRFPSRDHPDWDEYAK